MRRLVNVAVRLHMVTQTTSGAVLEADDEMGVEMEVYDGLASTGQPCAALSVSKGWRCPKTSAVGILVVGDAHVFLCGGHFDVHRRGRVLRLMDR